MAALQPSCRTLCLGGAKTRGTLSLQSTSRLCEYLAQAAMAVGVP